MNMRSGNGWNYKEAEVKHQPRTCGTWSLLASILQAYAGHHCSFAFFVVEAVHVELG
jgi:hypothetical protein